MSDNADVTWEDDVATIEWDHVAPADSPPLTDLQLLAVAVLRGDDTAAHALADAIVERARSDGYTPYAELVARVRALDRLHPETWVGRRVRVRVRVYPRPGSSEAGELMAGKVLAVKEAMFHGYTLLVSLANGAEYSVHAPGEDIELLD